MAGTYDCLSPATLLLASAVAALLVTTSSATATATATATAAADNYSGRMVIVRAAGARRVVVSTGSGLNKYWQRQRRLVEDEVAPDLGGLLGAAGIDYGALDPNKPVCLHGKCANPGESYTKDHCTYQNRCPH